ncbi:aminotransferase class I/II-fold pyridoxal phosphate-dependent enzyme [Sporohalobacter salinus]|uniref:MocR-like pyridoxine biosynthesis transcription factor PdxR n=1 Tax=Sporohalobacter salinus TaxID=1494606 RepID=UPI00195F9EB1|nr:DNA-binding transcriptional MocR family regulator [Sporohalobacter salinus]
MIENIELNKSATKHLYLQLYSQLKELILKKKLTADTKLPPIRKFARKLNVNNVTIVNAYNLLEEEELVYKKVGSGTFVAPLTVQHKEEQDNYLDEKVYIDEDTKFTDNQEEIINFATGAPTPNLFPIAPFKRLVNKVLDRDGGYAFGYQKSQGYLALRKTISSYIANYNIEANINEIQIISGAQQGIDILAKTFLDYGDTVFVERPTYPGAISVFNSRKANIVEIPITPEGIDITVLEEKLAKHNPKFLYLMPNFQNPTGYSYSKKNKERIIELANKYDLLIIEDDCLSNLNYTCDNNQSLKSLDQNERIIYIKSFSKVFMPGLRLAFLLIPERHFEDILISKYISDIFTDGLVQRVLDLYFKEEMWEKQITTLKETYSQRYLTMCKALEKFLPQEVKFITPQGGLNFWLELPTKLTDAKLQQEALQANINLAPGSVFYAASPPKNKIRLSIAAVSQKEIKQGIKRLGEIIKDQLEDSDYRLDDSFLPLV